jgi:hypothetical protein
MTLPHVTKEQAIALKELGFDWPTNCNYNTLHDKIVQYMNVFTSWNHKKQDGDFLQYSAPETALSLMWFRNVHGVGCAVNIIGISGYWQHNLENKSKYNTYEEAESALLDHLIEHLKEKRK